MTVTRSLMATTSRVGRGVANSIVCLLMASAIARAQAPRNLESVGVYAGKTVIVHELSGTAVSGRLVDATGAALTLSVNGMRQVIGVDAIASVGVRGDPIKDGVLKGLGVGGALTLLGHADVSGCSKPCFRNSAASQALGVALVGAIGGWLDARHTRERVVYEKP